MVFVPVLTYVFGPQNYDYESMRNIRKVDDRDIAAAAHVDIDLIPGEDPDPTDPNVDHTRIAAGAGGEEIGEEEKETRALNKAALYARSITLFMALSLLILWPIPMYGTSYVFSRRFFTGWAVVGIIWLFFTAFGVVLFPLYEGRHSIMRIARLMAFDIMGRGRKDNGFVTSETKEKESEDVKGAAASEDRKVAAADSEAESPGEQVSGGQSKEITEATE